MQRLFPARSKRGAHHVSAPVGYFEKASCVNTMRRRKTDILFLLYNGQRGFQCWPPSRLLCSLCFVSCWIIFFLSALCVFHRVCTTDRWPVQPQSNLTSRFRWITSSGDKSPAFEEAADKVDKALEDGGGPYFLGEGREAQVFWLRRCCSSLLFAE